MKVNARIFMALAALALAALACQAVAGGDDPETENPPVVLTDEPVSIPTPTESGPRVILNDDFSGQNWGTGTDEESAVEYVDEALNFNVFKNDYFVWSTPDSETYQDVHMDVTVTNNDTDSTTAFGFICDKGENNDFYYLVITPAGQYAIALAKEGESDTFLTNNGEWADSDLVEINAASYQMGADCGNGTLTLYVNGAQVASVNDSTYSSGRVAVMVWSADEPGKVSNVSFDDFVMTELP